MPLKVQKRILSVFSVAVFLFSVVADAGTIEWTFPRLGSCHEGLPFADGVTGVLAWGGGDTVNLTIGRGDLWDHRGGYPWTDSQSYSNIIALVKKNDGAVLKAEYLEMAADGMLGHAIRPIPYGRARQFYSREMCPQSVERALRRVYQGYESNQR